MKMKTKNSIVKVAVNLLFCLGIFCLSTNSAFGQDAPASQFEHIKGLEPFVGDWEGQLVSLGNDKPDEENAPLLSMNCQLTANKSYASFQFTTVVDEKSSNVGSIVVGWDAPNKQVMMWGFWPDQQVTGKGAIEGNSFSFAANGILADGTKTSSQVMFVCENEQVNVTVKERRNGDEEQPDLQYQFTPGKPHANSSEQ